MSKTLEKLFNKAMKTGHANINGRMRAYGYVGELESKYTMEYWKESGNFCLYHWGTLILEIGNILNSPDNNTTTFALEIPNQSFFLEINVKPKKKEKEVMNPYVVKKL